MTERKDPNPQPLTPGQQEILDSIPVLTRNASARIIGQETRAFVAIDTDKFLSAASKDLEDVVRHKVEVQPQLDFGPNGESRMGDHIEGTYAIGDRTGRHAKVDPSFFIPDKNSESPLEQEREVNVPMRGDRRFVDARVPRGTDIHEQEHHTLEQYPIDVKGQADVEKRRRVIRDAAKDMNWGNLDLVPRGTSGPMITGDGSKLEDKDDRNWVEPYPYEFSNRGLSPLGSTRAKEVMRDVLVEKGILEPKPTRLFVHLLDEAGKPLPEDAIELPYANHRDLMVDYVVRGTSVYKLFQASSDNHIIRMEYKLLAANVRRLD